MQQLSPSSSSPACPVPWIPLFPDEMEDTGQENCSQEIHPLIRPYALSDNLLTDTTFSVQADLFADDSPVPVVDPIASAPVRVSASIREEEHRLVERARAGDSEARAEMLVRILPPLKRIAIWYARAYSWACPSLDAQDLVQDVCLRLWQRMEAILEACDPLPFLMGMARAQVRWQVLRLASVPPSLSLDLPDPEDEDTPFHETLPTSILPASPYAGETKDYQALYQALDALPEEQRTLLALRYGLFTEAAHSPTHLEGVPTASGAVLTRATIRYQEGCALVTLFTLLREQESAYHDAAPPLTVHSLCGNDADLSERLSRLARAYEHLCAMGQQPTAKALARLAHVRREQAIYYLWTQDPQQCERNRQRESRRRDLQSVEAVPRKERLEAAAAQLQAAGQPLTVKTLAKLAHVGNDTAQQYLQHLDPLRYGHSRQQQQALSHQRLDEACARLQGSGVRITANRLVREAHVHFYVASAYLKARQAERANPANQV